MRVALPGGARCGARRRVAPTARCAARTRGEIARAAGFCRHRAGEHRITASWVRSSFDAVAEILETHFAPARRSQGPLDLLLCPRPFTETFGAP
jgi:hypothetical protein